MGEHGRLWRHQTAVDRSGQEAASALDKCIPPFCGRVIVAPGSCDRGRGARSKAVLSMLWQSAAGRLLRRSRQPVRLANAVIAHACCCKDPLGPAGERATRYPRYLFCGPLAFCTRNSCQTLRCSRAPPPVPVLQPALGPLATAAPLWWQAAAASVRPAPLYGASALRQVRRMRSTAPRSLLGVRCRPVAAARPRTLQALVLAVAVAACCAGLRFAKPAFLP